MKLGKVLSPVSAKERAAAPVVVPTASKEVVALPASNKDRVVSPPTETRSVLMTRKQLTDPFGSDDEDEQSPVKDRNDPDDSTRCQATTRDHRIIQRDEQVFFYTHLFTIITNNDDIQSNVHRFLRYLCCPALQLLLRLRSRKLRSLNQ